MKLIILTILTPIIMLLPAAVLLQPAYAATTACGKSTAAKQVGIGVGETNSGSCDESGVNKTVSAIIDILSFVVGIAAVVAMISGGFKYVTSGGDAGKVGNAKNTLIYALVGLAVAAIAQALVHFVINTAQNSVTGSALGSPSSIAISLPGLPSGDTSG